MTDPHSGTVYCIVGEGLLCVAYKGYLTPCRSPATQQHSHDVRAKTGVAYCDDHFSPIRDDVRAENEALIGTTSHTSSSLAGAGVLDGRRRGPEGPA